MINIFKLNNARERKEQNKLFVYKKILEIIHNRITISNEKGHGQTIYIIPKVLFGLPTYNQLKCAIYCVEKLKANGFIVVYTYPNMIFISWDHVPNTIDNPKFNTIENELKRNPDADYSNIIYKISNIKPSLPKLEYF